MATGSREVAAARRAQRQRLHARKIGTLSLLLQAGAALFLAVVLLGLVPRWARARWPEAAPALDLAALGFVLLGPAAFILWAAVRITRVRRDVEAGPTTGGTAGPHRGASPPD